MRQFLLLSNLASCQVTKQLRLRCLSSRFYNSRVVLRFYRAFLRTITKLGTDVPQCCFLTISKLFNCISASISMYLTSVFILHQNRIPKHLFLSLPKRNYSILVTFWPVIYILFSFHLFFNSYKLVDYHKILTCRFTVKFELHLIFYFNNIFLM